MRKPVSRVPSWSSRSCSAKMRANRQSDLAAMAGIARENVSRILSDWKRRMIVTRLAQQYCINNPTALKRELEDRPATTARPEERDGAAAAASGSTDCNL